MFLEDGAFFNLKMIEEGFATEYTFQGLEYEEQQNFKRAEQEAREKRMGLWEVCESY